MKNLSKLVGVLAISAAPAAFAHMDYFKEPYVGVEVYQTNQSFKKGAGKDILKKNPIDAALFAGFKFSHHFGLEAGWDQQFKKKKSNANVESHTVELLGNIFTGDAFANTNVQGRHPYVGLFGEYKHDAWRFQAMLGASFSKVKIRGTVVSVTGIVPTELQVGDVFTASKSKVVPMVRVSALYNFTHCFAVRVSGVYRNTSSIKMTMDQDSTLRLKMRDTFGLGLGVVYNFG